MRTQRGGYTFIEVLVVLVVGMIVLLGAFSTLLRQQEAYGQMGAMAGTQEDARTGLDVLSAELRELSAVGGDLLMATPDSLRFRALRKLGLVCDTDKNNKRLTVAQIGADPFAVGDSVIVYADQDSLRADDDVWQRGAVSALGSAVCITTLGLNLATLLPSANLSLLTLAGAGLKFDSIYPGAPVRSFETLSYRAGAWGGEDMLVRDADGAVSPLVGPLPATDGFALRYFDGSGTELTSFPLSAADRASVRRIRVEIHAERVGGGQAGTHQDSLISDVFTRGS